jgi:NitT/TauT family transport system substrate-binding protein
MRLDPAGILLLNRSRRVHRSRRIRQARYLLGAASGLAVLLAAGCAGSSTAGGPDSATITIAVVPGVDNAPVFLAQKDGLFAAAGLAHVVIKTEPTQTQELSALQNAQAGVDIAASDYGDVFYQQAQSPDLRILADGYDATSGVLEILTLPGSSIKSPLDLANQQVGLPDDDILPVNPGDPVSLEAAAATQVLSNYLGNDAASVQWQPMSQQQEVTDLVQHRLKAILVSEPYIFQAESQVGAVEVLDACSGSTANLPLYGYVAMNAWVRDNPVAVADFRSAIAKAQAQASMTGEVQRILPRAAGLTVQDADLVTIGAYPTATSANGLDRVVRLLADYNMIRVGPNASWSGAVPPMIVRNSG